MSRKSSIHFKAVSNVRFAVSHSERTDLSDPEYLLPKKHQLGNVIVAGSLSENELSALFIQQKERMTGQAKARGSSPFWEGVVVLSDTDGKAQSAKLQAWKVAYEEATGHKVLHMSVHLDEGYIDATGHPQYNPHAHVIVSRMDDKNKVISLGRKQMAAVQDLTSETLEMQRGSTLAERGGKRGRRHVGHREYRAQADEARLDLDSEKGRTALEGRLTDTLKQVLGNTKNKLKEAQAQADKVPQLEAQISTQAAEIARLNEQYRLDREALKASGEAKQADYQALKKDYEAALEDLRTTKLEAVKVPHLEAQVIQQAAELADLKAQYQVDREALKASGEATQRDYQALKIAYNKALEELTTTNARATKMDAYSERLKVDLAKSNEQIAAALREKAEAIEALVKSGEKSQVLLETAKGYRDDAAKIEKIAADFRAENLLLKAEIVEVKAKFETLAKTHQEEAAEAKEQASELRQLKAEYAGYREGAIATAAAEAAASAAKPVPTIQQPLQDVSSEARKAAQERPKQSEAPDSSPKAEKSLIERLVESLNTMLDWITGNSGKRIEINTQHSDNYGPVVQLDDLHAVQRTGRGLFVIHQLTHLDNIPALDDPKMEIKYRDGVGHVGGKLGKSGVQI